MDSSMSLSRSLFYRIGLYYEEKNQSSLSEIIMSDERAIQIFVTGIAMSVTQSIISSSKIFGEREIDQYLKLRKSFYPQFVKSASVFSDFLEKNGYENVSKDIRSLSKIKLGQEGSFFSKLPMIANKLGNFNIHKIEDHYTRKSFRPIFYIALLASDKSNDIDYRLINNRLTDVLNDVLKFASISSNIKTFFRKTIKAIESINYKETRATQFIDVANVGAWSNFSQEEKIDFQNRAINIRFEEEIASMIDDIDKRREEYKRLTQERIKLQNEAGINFDIISRGYRESVDEILNSEKQMTRDSLTDYVVTTWIKLQKQFIRDYPQYLRVSKHDINKVFTRINKAKTMDTARLVIGEAVEKKIFDNVSNFDLLAEQTKRNLAVKEGIPIAGLEWSPVDVDTFKNRHDVGEVVFGEGYNENEQQEMLGRVSRALSDIETVYGSKVAGRHARKLKIVFENGIGVSGGAAASYFGWDDRNRWQPRVKFGRDFDNLLAHEFSHYFDDLVANEIDKQRGKGRLGYGDVAHGPGDIFGNTGVKLGYAASNFENPQEGSWQSDVLKTVPELGEWIKAVNDSPDHERWKDAVPMAYDLVMDQAIKDVMGDIEWKEKEKIRNIDLKSKLPAGVADRAEELYRKAMGGDTRGLSYMHSVVEVWARMCEQYVYTKLSRDGIANPWLTRMSYDVDLPGNRVFMDQQYFDEVMVPIYDRLFVRLKETGMIGEWLSVSSLRALLTEVMRISV